MLFTMRLPLDRLSAKDRAMLMEIRRIYNFADTADVLRWLLEPDLTETVTKKLRKRIQAARNYEAIHQLGYPDDDDE